MILSKNSCFLNQSNDISKVLFQLRLPNGSQTSSKVKLPIHDWQISKWTGSQIETKACSSKTDCSVSMILEVFAFLLFTCGLHPLHLNAYIVSMSMKTNSTQELDGKLLGQAYPWAMPVGDINMLIPARTKVFTSLAIWGQGESIADPTGWIYRWAWNIQNILSLVRVIILYPQG